MWRWQSNKKLEYEDVFRALDKEKIQFKEKFIERYSNLTDWEEFKTCSLSFLHRSIRINTLKISVKELKEKLEFEKYFDP